MNTGTAGVQRTYERAGSTAVYPPRYHVIEEATGFRVEGRDRNTVFVRLSPDRTCFLIAKNADDVVSRDGNAMQCGLYSYYRLVDNIALIAMQDWRRPRNPPSYWSGVHAWAIDRTRRALHCRGVYLQWQRLLSLVPDPQRMVAKAVFAATFDSSLLGCETWSEVYQHPYLVGDILQYRAAAIALHYAEDLAYRVSSLLEQRRLVAPATFRPGPLTARFEAIRQRNAVNCFALCGTTQLAESLQKQVKARDRQDILDILIHDWKTLYAGGGATGTSLRRLLMNLPGGLSGRLLAGLPKLDLFLTRPITDRVELMTLLIWGEHVSLYSQTLITSDYWEGNIYVKASRDEILASLRLLSAYRARVLPDEPTLKPQKRGLEVLVGYLAHYCRACREAGVPAHRGNIVGLTKKAILWHRDVLEQEAQLRRALLDGTAPASLPPIPLPDNPAITFLRTVRDILDEGVVMHHCIASFASSAVQGQCYLFHVDYRGEHASVEVNLAGQVTQSYGPYNSTNAATEYGKALLSQWGRAFPQDAPSYVRRMPQFVNVDRYLPDGLPF